MMRFGARWIAVTTVAASVLAAQQPEAPPSVLPYFFPAGIAVDQVTAAGVISTVAGTGVRGFAGDNGPAVSAQLKSPLGLALDAQGNLYVADSGNSRVRKITPDGQISSVAGNGTRIFAGDNGPAATAQLSTPYRVALDASGALYIADAGNQRVRKVTSGGVITTVQPVGAQPAPFLLGDPVAGPFRVGGGVSAPASVVIVEPQFSETARRAGFEGVVVIESIVQKDGTLRLVRVVRGLGFGLDESAISSLRQWRLKPSERNGQPVDVILNVEVKFTLR